jgi:drug/metabolite transporter (DMT)-like permease
MHDRSAHLAGIGLMLLATLMFSLNDVLGKWLVATYSVGQILLLRSIAALLMLSPFILRTGWAGFRHAERPGLQVLRGCLSTFEVACFYLSVFFLPLADAMTFYLAGPIYVTALSAIFLHEKVGIFRWSAVIVGFIGVIIALNPGAGSFGVGSLVALLGSFVYSIFMVVTRQLKSTPNAVLASAQSLSAVLFGAVLAPFSWVPVTSSVHYLLLLILGSVSIAAIVCVNHSLRIAPASVVVPYQYTLIVWAIVFGFAAFGDVPQAHTLIGAAIIVASGIVIFLREQRLPRHADDKPPIVEPTA